MDPDLVAELDEEWPELAALFGDVIEVIGVPMIALPAQELNESAGRFLDANVTASAAAVLVRAADWAGAGGRPGATVSRAGTIYVAQTVRHIAGVYVEVELAEAAQ